MVQNEKISVIIPVYNSEKYLEASIRSIMGQTWRNLEIICVNDGSTDSSADILARLASEDSRIKVVSQANSGQGCARNAGLAASDAEWVTFPDSDDILVPYAYETAAKAFSEDADMVHFSIKVVNENGGKPSEAVEKYYTVCADGFVPMSDGIIAHSDGSVSNKLFRRSVMERYGVRFEKIRYEDYQFSREYMLVARNVFCISEPLYLYLRHDGSTMAQTFNGSPYAIDHLKAYRMIENFSVRNDLGSRFDRLAPELFVNCYWFAARWATKELRPQVLALADAVYDGNGVLKSTVRRFERHGTVGYEQKKDHHIMTKVLEFIFSVKYETYDYVPYKVVVLFGVTVCKWRLKD